MEFLKITANLLYNQCNYLNQVNNFYYQQIENIKN